METQLVPPPALEHVTRSGRKHYPASYYYRVEEVEEGSRVYRYKGRAAKTYIITPITVQIFSGGSLFNPSGTLTYPVGSLRYRATVALFNGLEDTELYWTNPDTWVDMISSMAYLNKLPTLDKTQQKQADLVKKYAPAE